MAVEEKDAKEKKDEEEEVLRRHASVHGHTTKKWYFYKGPGAGDMSRMLILGGSTYPELSEDICRLLGIAVGKTTLSRFADGECNVHILETVLGKDVFVVTPTHTNDSLVELLLIVSAVRRASAARITAVVPFYGYARQDRRFRREPIAAADIARMLEAMGVDRVMAIDLHSGQIQGFFPPAVPVDHLTPMGVAAAYFAEQVTEQLRLHAANGGDAAEGGEGEKGSGAAVAVQAVADAGLAPGGGGGHGGGGQGTGAGAGAGFKPTKIVVVAPQEGQVGRAKLFQEHLTHYLGDGEAKDEDGNLVGIPITLAFIARSSTKDRDKDFEEVHKHLIGDVKGAMCIVVDDLVDTGGTLINAVQLLQAAGAGKITAFATHGRFSGGGNDEIMAADGLNYLVVTNTLPHREADGSLTERSRGGRIRELSIAPLLAEAIYRVHMGIPFTELIFGDRPLPKGILLGRGGARAPPGGSDSGPPPRDPTE